MIETKALEMTSSKDMQYMRGALALARRGLGRTWPNPSVGCVLVNSSIVVGRGWTADGGRPHAETRALEQAGIQAKNATAYVTFEPCAHTGETLPCAGALIDAGIKRVVVACVDPDPRVSGQGIQMLRDAGVEVDAGVFGDEAFELNKGFILRVTDKRPLVTLKTATSSDGKISGGAETQGWITCGLARKRGHLERSQHDAILVGIGTVLADDPMLTTRLPENKHNIVRIVLDTGLRIPLDSQIIKSATFFPLLILHNSSNSSKAGDLKKAGAELFKLDPRDINSVLKLLAEKGITRLLIEGGAKIHSSFLEAGFCDRFLWFKAPEKIGDNGLDALNGHDIKKIEVDFSLKHKKTCHLEQDLLEVYTRCA